MALPDLDKRLRSADSNTDGGFEVLPRLGLAKNYVTLPVQQDKRDIFINTNRNISTKEQRYLYDEVKKR